MDLFLTNKLFTSQDVNRWTWVVWITCALFWCFYHLFQLSFWRHPFTAEESKWWDAELLHWALERVHFHFWMNYSFNGIIIQMYTRKLRKCGPQKVFVIIWIQIFALQTATWFPFTVLRPWRGSQDQYMFTDYINCVWLAFYPSIVWNDIKHWLTYYKNIRQYTGYTVEHWMYCILYIVLTFSLRSCLFLNTQKLSLTTTDAPLLEKLSGQQNHTIIWECIREPASENTQIQNMKESSKNKTVWISEWNKRVRSDKSQGTKSPFKL